MRCYNHPSVEAVGTCKACSKGLCMECAADLGHGLACKSSHIAEVENLNALITSSTRITTTNTRGKFLAPAFYGFMGLTFLGYGLMSTRASIFGIVMGIGFLAFAIFTLAANLKAFGK